MPLESGGGVSFGGAPEFGCGALDVAQTKAGDCMIDLIKQKATRKKESVCIMDRNNDANKLTHTG
jgi:hypothetical protein